MDCAPIIGATLAGVRDQPGHVNATGAAARFAQPYDVVQLPGGDLVVSDFENHRLRRVTLAGVVTDFAGTGTIGGTDGAIASATFDSPQGLAIDSAGVIGQVTRTYPFLAEVTQITDRNQAVPVQNLRSGLRAIVFGNGREGTLDLRFMPVNADVQVGDTLVTSGIDGVYPAGLPVAKIVDIERNATMAFARITCEPLSGVDRRSHVLVLNSMRELPERPADTPEPALTRKKVRRGAS